MTAAGEQLLDSDLEDNLDSDSDSILFDYPEDDEPGVAEEENREDYDPLQRVAPDYPGDADELAGSNDDDQDEDDYQAYTDATEADDGANAGSEGEPYDQELTGQPSEQRQDPSLGSLAEFEAGDDEFSMTAGERIGYDNPTDNQSKQDKQAKQEEQTGLFDAMEDSVETEPEPKRRSLFSAFRRKPESDSTDKGIADAQDVPEDLADPIEELEQNFDDSAVGGVHEPMEPTEVVVINVMASEGYVFAGDDLLQVLITAGLKFGDMNIFHQRLDNDSRGPVVFSVANILNPGTFDLNSMDEFTTLGISLFLALPTPTNNLEAFEQMLNVAQQIRGALDGELRDDNRNIMTAQTIEHYRQRIRDFELRRLKAVGSHG